MISSLLFRSLLFCGVALIASASQAATVKFSGTYSLLAGVDSLGINGKAFLATVETNNAAGIINGQMWLSPATVAATQNFPLVGGTVTLGGGNTTFSGIAAGGGSLSFQLNQQAAGFSQADYFAIAGSGGASTWIVGGNIYSATITAVPEPASMLALAGLVVGCAGVSYRRRLRNAVA
jgi:hypothetical protein